ncbi:hypothetical protein [uncultured Serinicoccus sp.]|uniref:hypothetical protein n=1 Tax=uncultured Serinicoccus sp. TaxID=735514 RepID=UPI002632A07B|nr:hypothetical protein [uncultured Serinicoccus sp.]
MEKSIALLAFVGTSIQAWGWIALRFTQEVERMEAADTRADRIRALKAKPPMTERIAWASLWLASAMYAWDVWIG